MYSWTRSNFPSRLDPLSVSTTDHPGDKAHYRRQRPVAQRYGPPGLGGLSGLLVSGHRNRARGGRTWRNDLWGWTLHRNHAGRFGLRQGGLGQSGLRWRGLGRSLRSLHRRHARGRLGRAGRRGFFAHVRGVVDLDEMQTVLAGRGVCKDAGTGRRPGHIVCGGYCHRERCEGYDSCRRNPECFHLATFREQCRIFYFPI
jgi:hypothetical protein